MGNWVRETSIDDVIDRINDMGHKHGGASNPDVYGRVFEYQLSLREALDSREENWDEVLKWRGIVALLALKDYLKLDIVIEKKQIPQTGFMDIAFPHALSLKPQVVMFSKNQNENWDWNWEQFYVIKLKQPEEKYVDIALFSPITIIYPVVELEKKMPDLHQVSWFKRIDGRGEFLDPAICLKEEEKIVVAYWLEKIGNRLTTLSKTREVDKVMLSTILNLIRDYQSDLNIGNNNFGWLSMINISETDDVWNVKLAEQIGVKDFIGKTVKLEISIGKDRIGIHDIFAEDIYCFKWKKVEGEKDRNRKPFINAEYADKYKILLNRGDNSTEEYYAFIPLGEKFINLLLKNENDISNIMDVFSMKLSKDKKKIVAQIKFSKIYKNGIDLTYEYPFSSFQEISIALWPQKFHTEWNKYFIYFDDNASGMKIRLPEETEEKHKERSRCSIYQCKCYPRVIGVCNRGECYAGVIFLKNACDMDEANRSASVYVDFGTSGTITYAKIENEEEQEIIFVGEGALPLLLKNEEGDLREISQNFIPVTITERRMYSIYRQFGNTTQIKPMPLRDGIIYMAGNMEMLLEDEKESKYLTNLKWMTNSDRGWFLAFMEQLCMQITWHLLCRGVKNIEWKYALPLSLGSDKRKSVETAWEECIIKYLRDVSKVNSNVLGVVTESRAVSDYFYLHRSVTASEILNKEVGYLAVDIGGGSVDFALWQGDNVMWEASAHLAGREIFSKQMFQYVQELEYVLDNKEDENFIKKLKAISNMGKKQGYMVAIAFFERLISEDSSKLQRAISDRSADDHMEWIGNLRSKIALGAAMVLFAAGQIAGEAIRSGKFQIKCEGRFYIVLAGNGSNLFDWIYNSSWEKITEEQHEYFANMFLEGVKSRMTPYGQEYEKMETTDIKIIKSPCPKKEVALGLCSNKEIEIDKMEQLESAFEVSDITAWIRAFLESFEDNFSKNRYSHYLFGNRELVRKMQSDEIWTNLAKRQSGNGKEASTIMMTDVLSQLYRELEKKGGRY